MNTAINYYSAAQHQADALREARRNPIADVPAHEERRAPAQGWRRAALAWRAPLRPLLVRL